jgi:hypothetical protein
LPDSVTGPRERAPLARDAVIRLMLDMDLSPDSRIERREWGILRKLLILLERVGVTGGQAPG